MTTTNETPEHRNYSLSDHQNANQPTDSAPTEHSAASRKGRRRAAIGGTALAVVAVACGGGYAVAQMTSDSAAMTSTSAAQGAQGGTGGRDSAGGVGNVGHATPPTGTVAATTSSSLTVKLTTGATTTYTLGSDAVVENDGRAAVRCPPSRSANR